MVRMEEEQLTHSSFSGGPEPGRKLLVVLATPDQTAFVPLFKYIILQRRIQAAHNSRWSQAVDRSALLIAVAAAVRLMV